MDAFSYIKNELNTRGIELCGCVPYSVCREKYAHKLSRAGLYPSGGLSVIIFAVPYLSREAYFADKRSISLYACARDYHEYFENLKAELLPDLSEKFQGYSFAMFSDASPIDEVHASARAGLGVLGENRMLITEKYSSFVFLGEIITNAPIENYTEAEAKGCEGCGSCRDACPMGAHGCISALTQKKGILSDSEVSDILRAGSAWGCDACQLACPHTKRAVENGSIFTGIEFFREGILTKPSHSEIEGMDDSDFMSRAYSWRGRGVILRNLLLLEAAQNKNEEDVGC